MEGYLMLAVDHIGRRVALDLLRVARVEYGIGQRHALDGHGRLVRTSEPVAFVHHDNGDTCTLAGAEATRVYENYKRARQARLSLITVG